MEWDKIMKSVKKVTSIKYLLWDIDGTLLNFEFAEDKAIHNLPKSYFNTSNSNRRISKKIIT